MRLGSGGGGGGSCCLFPLSPFYFLSFSGARLSKEYMYYELLQLDVEGEIILRRELGLFIFICKKTYPGN